MSNQILDVNAKQTTNDYPYGRLRATAFFSVEFKSKKGFRHVFQTINPKDGRLNNPKNSTYSDLCWLELDPTNGHFVERQININSFESINKLAKFINENFDKLNLTKEMIEDICAKMTGVARVSAKWCNNWEGVKDMILPSMQKMIHGLKTGENVFGEINFPIADIEANKVEVKMTSETITFN